MKFLSWCHQKDLFFELCWAEKKFSQLSVFIDFVWMKHIENGVHELPKNEKIAKNFSKLNNFYINENMFTMKMRDCLSETVFRKLPWSKYEEKSQNISRMY